MVTLFLRSRIFLALKTLYIWAKKVGLPRPLEAKKEEIPASLAQQHDQSHLGLQTMLVVAIHRRTFHVRMILSEIACFLP